MKEAQAKRMALFDWTRKASSKDYWKLNKFTNVAPKVNPNRSRKANSEFKDSVNNDELSKKSLAGNSGKVSQSLSGAGVNNQ